jgi:hypothetical protein
MKQFSESEKAFGPKRFTARTGMPLAPLEIAALCLLAAAFALVADWARIVFLIVVASLFWYLKRFGPRACLELTSSSLKYSVRQVSEEIALSDITVVSLASNKLVGKSIYVTAQITKSGSTERRPSERVVQIPDVFEKSLDELKVLIEAAKDRAMSQSG